MELSVHQDKITSLMRRVKNNEANRASDAGYDREEIGSLLELTGLHKKAFSFVRSLDKMTEDKRADCLRSLNPLLEMMDGVWNGQKTPDMFDGSSVPAGEAQTEADPDDDETDDEVEDDETDPELATDDAEFEAHLAEVSEAAE